MTTILGGDSSDGVKFTSQSRKHALVIPVSGQAHVAGIYRHAVQLAERGVTVTFVSLAEDIARMETYDELQGLDFHLISYDSSFGPPKVGGSSPVLDLVEHIEAAGRHFQPILAELKAKQKAGLPGPTCVVFDRFCSSWVRDVAKELNIPLYTFFSCGAVYARFLQEIPRLISDGTLVIKEDGTLLEFEGFVTIAGLPKLLYSDLPSTSRLRPGMNVSMGQMLADTDAVIVNSFYELESPQIDEMQRHWAEHCVGRKIPKLFLVGPVSNARTYKDRSFVTGLDNRGTDSLEWLDRRQPQSVLYICLGSRFRWEPQLAHELARALESSEQSFLWVLPLSSTVPSLEEALPAGFQERTRERGLVVSGWVPQQRILSHSSLGGFLTHCGWNSLIESISSGVPMIAFPQGAEQYLNSRYFVDVMKIAVPVGDRNSAPSLIRDKEFEKALRLLMVEEEGKAIRSRIEGLKTKAMAAVADGGPSPRAITEIIVSIPGEL